MGLRKILGLLVSLALFASVLSLGSLDAEAFSSNTPIIVPVPVLTPSPTAYCVSYWYELPNAYENTSAYLTQNAATQGQSSNRGEWRPVLPQTGYYSIEVFIPAHAPIVWSCNTTKTINADTKTAQYVVLSSLSPITVTVDQAANAGQWVSLGNYYLAAGSGAALRLTDLTGGTAFVNTVSFSAARFTPAPNSAQLLLPVVKQSAITDDNLSFTSLVALGREQAPRSRYDAFEPVIYRLSGQNTSGVPRETNLAWSVAGPCGGGVITETLPVLGVGAWTQSVTTTIPACTGTYTVTAQVSGTVLSKSIKLNVDAGGELKLISRHLFDTANLPSLGTMQAWWTDSPYWGIGAYLGGAAFCKSCTFVTNINRDWVKDVQKMGWSFLPVWVGPQAPCFIRNTAKMSADPLVARQEGHDEALKAYAAAINLGLTEASSLKTTIYYDIEAYPNQAACHEAVTQFLMGWTEQLHAFSLRSGAYGLTSSANYGNWANLAVPPDSVWMAYGIHAGYSPTTTVSSIPNFNASWFSNHQRVFQYSLDKKESWGGVSMSIDSDVADTPLLVSRWLTSTVAAADDTAVTVYNRVDEFQMVNALQGWVMKNNQMFWTTDAGNTWQERLLPIHLAAGLSFEKAYFRSPQEGWILARSVDGRVLLHTGDSLTWDMITLPDVEDAQPTAMIFDQANRGWLEFSQPGLMPENENILLQTANLGTTWQEFSSNQAIRLDTAKRSRTNWPLDFGAGQTANVYSGAPISAELISPKTMTLPEGTDQVAFISSSQAWAHTFIGRCSGEKGRPGFTCTVQTALWATADGGASWKLLIK